MFENAFNLKFNLHKAYTDIGIQDGDAVRLGYIYDIPQDEIGDCSAFTQGLAAWCMARGLKGRFGVEAQGLDIEGDRVVAVRGSAGRLPADAVVVALGSWTAPFLRKATGLRVPIYPVKGVSLTAPREPWPGAPRTAIIDDVRKYD